MTLTTLIIYIGITGLILTLISAFVLKKKDNLLMSFLQNFCGAWFVFSGWVKAIDPLGTGYKMQDYFKEFESTFETTYVSFISPLFPFLAEYATGISVSMIILEVILGLALIIGFRPKLTSWFFWGLLIFFTILTGFTFLTGYVPEGGTFFNFGSWGEYNANNMKVKDCGCFGDFIKLEPKISFFKDLFLLIPAMFFLLKSSKMHQLFSRSLRHILIGVTFIATLIYCISNFMWDIPRIDFRPFSEGKDIRATRIAEENAQGAVQILSWKLKNRNDGKIVELPNAIYMKEMMTNYPKKDWEIIDQIKTEPTIKATKISEFEITDANWNDLTYDFLEGEGPSFMIVSYKLYGKTNIEKSIIKDSVFVADTIFKNQNIVSINKIFKGLEEKSIQQKTFDWDPTFSKNMKKMGAIANEIASKDIPVYFIAGGAGAEELEAIQKDFNMDKVVMGMADDILLKTIVRSNPGLVYWNNGKIIDKWHINKLNSAKEVITKHL